MSGGRPPAWKVTLEIHLGQERAVSHDTQQRVQARDSEILENANRDDARGRFQYGKIMEIGVGYGGNRCSDATGRAQSAAIGL